MAVREIPELKADILRLKSETNTAVIAHYYTDPDLQDIADLCGDSLELAAAAKSIEQPRVVVCAPFFAAETIAVLCPEKEVILAHSQSRCPMSGQIYPGRIKMFLDEHPGTYAVTGLNASAALKSECSLCVTQSNAVQVMRRCGAQNVLFASDRNLGEYLSENLPDIHFTVLNCSCPMLNSPSVQDVELARQKWPGAALAVNMGCGSELRSSADMVGSTADIIRYCEAVDWDVIISDAVSVCQLLQRRHPDRSFHQLAPSKLMCSSMRIITLEITERAIKGDFGMRVTPDTQYSDRAAIPVRRMMELSGESGSI